MENRNLAKKDTELLQALMDGQYDSQENENEQSPERSIKIVKTYLEIAENSIEQGGVLSAERANEVVEEVVRAREEGLDLSQIPDLDERLARITKEAPLVTVKACLDRAEEYSQESSPEHIVASANWYWEARANLQKLREKISSEEALQFEERLSDVAERISVDQSIPIDEDVLSDNQYVKLKEVVWSELEEEGSLSEQVGKAQRVFNEVIEGIKENQATLKQRYERLFKSGFDNLARLPRGLEFSQRIAKGMTEADEVMSDLFEIMERRQRHAKEEARDIFQRMALHVNTQAELKEAYHEIGEIIGELKFEEAETEKTLSQVKEAILDWIPLCKN